MTGITPGALSAAIIEVARQTPNCRLRHIMQTLTPRGYNGHSIRTTVTTLVKGGVLLCDRSQRPAGYSVPVEPAGLPMTQRVLDLLQVSTEPMFSRDVIAAFPGIEAFSIRNALMLLQENGRVSRIGKRHHYRYFATGADVPHGDSGSYQAHLPVSNTASGISPALAPNWPRPAGQASSLLRWSLAA